jgi:ParB-like chromosome segregation protein Spo0J
MLDDRAGFDPSHAILVRQLAGGYQIVSGHTRTTTARRAGLARVPAWVQEMGRRHCVHGTRALEYAG